MDRQKVKSGLGLMFWGNIVALFAVIPILGVIAALVGGIMELIAVSYTHLTLPTILRV